MSTAVARGVDCPAIPVVGRMVDGFVALRTVTDFPAVVTNATERLAVRVATVLLSACGVTRGARLETAIELSPGTGTEPTTGNAVASSTAVENFAASAPVPQSVNALVRPEVAALVIDRSSSSAGTSAHSRSRTAARALFKSWRTADARLGAFAARAGRGVMAVAVGDSSRPQHDQPRTFDRCRMLVRAACAPARLSHPKARLRRRGERLPRPDGRELGGRDRRPLPPPSDSAPSRVTPGMAG